MNGARHRLAPDRFPSLVLIGDDDYVIRAHVLDCSYAVRHIRSGQRPLGWLYVRDATAIGGVKLCPCAVGSPSQ